MRCLRNAQSGTYCPCFANPIGIWNADEDEDEECEYELYADPVGDADEVVERNWSWKWDDDGDYNKDTSIRTHPDGNTQ